MDFLKKALIKAYKEHGNIIVGVDYDNTLVPYGPDINNKELQERCEQVIQVIKDLKEHIILCLYTLDEPNVVKLKVENMCSIGIEPDYVNESPIKFWGDCIKPYFNILLDDKAGLNEALQVLTEFKIIVTQ